MEKKREKIEAGKRRGKIRKGKFTHGELSPFLLLSCFAGTELY